MTKHSYRKDIHTVVLNKIVIGYIARTDAIYGIDMDVPLRWTTTTNITNPVWQGAYASRREAREALAAENPHFGGRRNEC